MLGLGLDVGDSTPSVLLFFDHHRCAHALKPDKCSPMHCAVHLSTPMHAQIPLQCWRRLPTLLCSAQTQAEQNDRHFGHQSFPRCHRRCSRSVVCLPSSCIPHEQLRPSPTQTTSAGRTNLWLPTFFLMVAHTCVRILMISR